MKRCELWILILLFSLLGCRSSTEINADIYLEKAIHSIMGSDKFKINDKKFIYTAPNDSLAVIEFSFSVGEYEPDTMHFAYVLSPNDDYVVFFPSKNPVKYAKNNLKKGFDEAGVDFGESKQDDELLYSAIRMQCSSALYSGLGKYVKDLK